MLVSGGFNTEAKVTLDDFNLFDFNEEMWIDTRMVKECSRQKFEPNCLFENNLTRVKDIKVMNERKKHKMCAVWD